MAVTFEVSNVNELMSALASASGGDTISLAAANYGYVQFTGQNFNSEVRIVSADADNPAQFDRIEFESSSNITLDSIKVAFPSNGGQGTRVVNINNSSDISIVDSEVHGRVDGTYEGFGIRVKDSSGILIDNNFVHNVMNGIAVFSADSVTVSENYIDYVGADFMKGGGLTDFVYANNIGGGNLFPSPTAHADFIQFQGSSYDGVISGNVFLSQTSERAQGIFMSNGTYGNVLVEQNILYTGKANGIKIFGEGGIVVRNNTVLSTPDAGHESSYVSLPNGGVSENNIYTVDFDAGTKGSNLIVQHSKSNGVNFYGDVFVDAMGGVGDISLEGLMPAPGSPAEGKGAYERLLQLLGEDSSYVAPPVPPAPSDDPGTDEAEAPTDPVPFPEPIEGSVFSMVGALVVSGAQDVVEVAHSAEFELASSTLALSFNADTTSGRKGIFTKDASGGGDHVAVYIENGTLYVRVQDGGKQVVLTEGNIGTGRDYDLHVVFGGGNVVALLDGEVIGEAATGMSWADNAEVMQIGGLGWASNSGQAGFGNPFDGTISDVVVVEGKPGWDAVEAIRFGEPLPDTDPDPDPDDVPQPAPLPDPPDDGDEPPAPDEDLVPIFGFDGALEITGPADVLEIAHGEDFELSSATLALTFNADSVDGRKGIVAKDAYGGGDHFAVYIENGTLVIRVQDGDKQALLSAEGIEAGRDYDLHIALGDGSVGALLDGAAFGEAAIDMSLAENVEVMQVGGLGWGSESGEAGFGDPFDGTISDFVIVEGKPGYLAVEALRTDASDPVPVPDPDPTDTTDLIGEVQQITLTHEKTTVALDGSYDDPVVFAQIATVNGLQTVAVRIDEVGSDSVTLRLQEPNAYDGWHMTEVVTLFVVEAGTHILADGTRIEAGKVETQKLTSDGFEDIAFSQAFESAPTVLSQVQTSNGADFVVTRQKRADEEGFELAMQEEEAQNGTGHATETVGWIAMDRGVGEWSGTVFEAGSTGRTFDHSVSSQSFEAEFVETPAMLASLSSFHGSDTAVTRLSDIDASGFDGFLQEEVSLDAELIHTTETVDYIAFEETGTLMGVSAPVTEELAMLGVAIDSDALVF